MTGMRIVGNVTHLPTTTFGHRTSMWWGTLGYVVIEGSTLLICAVAYVYFRKNFQSWPPERVFRPGLAAAAVQAAIMLLSNWPMVLVDRAARRLDLRAVQRGMVLITVLSIAMCVLRGFEFQALNVRWDSNAYGSAAWAVLTTHAILLLLQTVETIVFTLLLFSPNLEQRDLSAASDNALYWYFMTGSWIPLAAVVFLMPYLV